MDSPDSLLVLVRWQPPLFAASTWVLIISAVVLFFVPIRDFVTRTRPAVAGSTNHSSQRLHQGQWNSKQSSDYTRTTYINVQVNKYNCYDHWCHQYLASLGFSGPKPKIFVGSTFDWLLNKRGLYGCHEEYTAKFGKIVGVYARWRPIVIVSDVELVKLMCVKDFSSFPNRRSSPITIKPFDKALTALRDDHWKDVRGILSPTFSGSKMKLMAPLINECLDPMIRKVTKHHQEGKCIQLKEIYGGYLIDAIGSAAFGLTINSQETENDPFLFHAKKMFTFNMAIYLLIFFPFLAPVLNLFKVTAFDQKAINFFENVMDQAVELRKSGTERRVDFLQLMLDAHQRSDQDKAQATEEEKLEEEHRKTMTKKSLTIDELKSQGLTFFLAGYETSSTTLGFASYLLATNPEVQDKLMAEIDALAPGRDDVTYENITKMTYLDWIICESLRMYPAAFITSREAGHDYKYRGLTIPKSTEIFISIWQIHHDPDLWEEPDKFNPDRFAPEKREKLHPCAWIPFGTGPRNCIGMRFALLQVKMGLVRMLQNFRLETCAETEIPPVLGKFGFLTPANGFKLSAVPRS